MGTLRRVTGIILGTQSLGLYDKMTFDRANPAGPSYRWHCGTLLQAAAPDRPASLLRDDTQQIVEWPAADAERTTDDYHLFRAAIDDGRIPVAEG